VDQSSIALHVALEPNYHACGRVSIPLPAFAHPLFKVVLVDDVLRSIFEFCAAAQWRSPLRMWIICKSWRNVVLKTPRAWRLDVLHRIDEDHIVTWLELAGTRQNIRLIVPQHATVKWLDIVFTRPNRIVYLRLHGHFNLMLKRFPHVTKLDLFEDDHLIRDSELYGAIELFSLNLYPSLTTLNIVSMRRSARWSYPITQPPLITTLTLECMYPRNWKRLIVACASTIVDLKLSFPPNCEEFSDSAPTALPNLAAFSIRASRFDMLILTPQLTFLHLYPSNLAILWSIDMSHVTTLVVEQPIHDSLFSFPAIERILVDSHSGTENFLVFLLTLPRGDRFPHLSRIAVPIELYNKVSPPLEKVRERGVILEVVTDTQVVEDEWKSLHVPLS
jgi:hypothetical protein